MVVRNWKLVPIAIVRKHIIRFYLEAFLTYRHFIPYLAAHVILQ
jgi:hypothetical protein